MSDVGSTNRPPSVVRLRPAGLRLFLVPAGCLCLTIGLGGVVPSDIPVDERVWLGLWLMFGFQALFAAAFMGATLRPTGVIAQGWIRRRSTRWEQVEVVELGWVGSLRTGRAFYGPVLKLRNGAELRIRPLGAPIKPARLASSRVARETALIRAYHEAARVRQ